MQRDADMVVVIMGVDDQMMLSEGWHMAIYLFIDGG